MLGEIGDGVARALLFAALAGGVVAVAPAASAQSDMRAFDIPAQPLGAALIDLSRQSDVLIFFSPDVARGKRSRPLRGSMPVNIAIATLLRGTDLRAVPNPKGGYRVERIARGRPVAAVRPRDIRQSARPPTRPVQQAEPPSPSEIIVTAQKRSERLRDTPVPVTALDGRKLAEQNNIRLQDYADQLPGLSLNAQGNGKMNIVIRGISTGVFGNPTVAVTIDDVPYGSSVALADGQLVQPDLDPGDLQRIEVLRGPQGTLYGASSLGGLIKYVTADPMTDRIFGRVEADIGAVRSGEVGYGLRGALNLPLNEQAALRLSAYSRRTPGFVDNVRTGGHDVNGIDVTGGRIGLLWKPEARLAIRLGVVHQTSTGDGSARVTTDYLQRPLVGDLNQTLLPGSGRYRTRATLVTANVDLELGDADLKWVSGYGHNRNREAGAFASLGDSAQLANDMRTRKFTQEVRLSASPGRRFEWRLGGFYTKERSDSYQRIDQIDPVTGAIQSNLLVANFPTRYEEIAAFGDATYHVTEKLSLQGGLRYSANRQRYSEIDTGPLGESTPGVPFTAASRSRDDALTFLFVPRYRFDTHLMGYFRFASGYRPGGPNGSAAVRNLPETFDADTTLNYELGIKGDAVGGRLTFDMSVFHIDWQKVQVRLLDEATQFSYFTNGGEARSNGFEASVQYRTPQGLRVSANGSYNEARYTQTPPAGSGAGKGDRLPFSPKFSGNLSVDQDIALGSGWTPSVGATFAYVSGRWGEFARRPENIRVEWPGFVRLDVRASLRSDIWTIALFARNITDERGVMSSTSDTSRAQIDSIFGTNFISPRTLGVYLGRYF